MKKTLIISVVMMIVTFVYSKYQLSTTTDHGLKSISTYTEMQEVLSDYATISIEDLFVSETDSDAIAQSMLNSKKTILTKFNSDSILVHGELNIFVVTVKDYFKLYPSSYVQKAEITKVITGNDSMTDEEIMLSQTYGLYETEDGTFVMGTRGRNFLKPNHSYLVFCEKCEISDYIDTPAYRTLHNTFSTIDLTEKTVLAADGERYADFAECEFLVRNQNVADAINEVKNYIISEYQ